MALADAVFKPCRIVYDDQNGSASRSTPQNMPCEQA
jgi:hypothetical protein